MAIALAVPLLAPAVPAMQAAAGLLAAGIAAHISQGLQPAQPPPLPFGADLNWDPVSVIAGIAASVAAGTAQIPASLTDWLKDIKAMAASWWKWMNPGKPIANTGPGMAVSQDTRFQMTTSPRVVRYKLSATYIPLVYDGENWVHGSTTKTELGYNDAGYPRATNLTPKTAISPIYETKPPWSPTRAPHQEITTWVEGTDSIGGFYRNKIEKGLAAPGTYTWKVEPDETDRSGWVTVDNIPEYHPPRARRAARIVTAASPPVPDIKKKAPPLVKDRPVDAISVAIPVSDRESVGAIPGVIAPAPPISRPIPIPGPIAQPGTGTATGTDVGTGTSGDVGTATGTGTGGSTGTGSGSSDWPSSIPVAPPSVGPDTGPIVRPGGDVVTGPIGNVGPDGKVQTRPQNPPIVTPETGHVIGDQVIVAPDVRPDVRAIATELGRVERKTASLLGNGPSLGGMSDLFEKMGLLQYLMEAIGESQTDTVPYKEWRVEAPCDKDPWQNPVVFEAYIPAGNPMQAALYRLNALLDYVEATQSWRRPVGKMQGPTTTVTITAYSLNDDGSANEKRHKGVLIKNVSYPMPITKETEEQVAISAAAHWHGFQWESGRYIAEWVSRDKGQLQAWGVSHEEAKGVVRHALAHMGVEESAGQWIESVSRNPRFGRVATVRAAHASARSGSSQTAPSVSMLDYSDLVS